jgi:class 3 adenylate cyclase
VYSKFRSLLSSAEGQNEWVVAVNADIRGFSSVMSGDPAQTALYLRAVYGRMLDDYFQSRSFFKPTGDGLMIVVPFKPSEDELAAATRSVVDDALHLHDEFGSIVDGDRLIKFPSPSSIGVGLSVGSVSRLVAGKLTLDYTGRPLNIATRLMDLARPSGVVLDASLDFDALDAETRERFSSARVWVKGGPESGVDVLYTAEPTRIPERHRKPTLAPVPFTEPQRKITRQTAQHRGTSWSIPLTHEPSDRSEIELVVSSRKYRNNKPVPDEVRLLFPEFKYETRLGRPYLTLDFTKVATFMRNLGVPARAEAAWYDIAYTVDPDDLEAATASDDDIPF